MASPAQDLREVPEMSPDPRIRVFRRVLHDFEEFEGMEVDAYVVLGTSHVVLLDTLLCPADMASLMASIEPMINGRQVLCVNSHADWDHVWGNSYFRSRPLPILAHEACRQRLCAPDALHTLKDYKKKTPLFEDVVITPPTLTFSERLSIVDSSLTIELLHAPGHCHDQIVAWLPALRLLLAFDAVEMPLPCIEGSTCAPLMLSTLQRLAALDAQYVLCSHGNTTSPALIHENLAYFHTLEQRSRALLQNHTPTETELQTAATLLKYPFEEAIAHTTWKGDYAYYSWVHEQNAQAILRWLMIA